MSELFGEDARISLIFNEENLGFTKAHNKLFKLILKEKDSPKYIALLNNDTIVEPNWLTELLLCAKESEASMIASKMVNFYDRTKIDNVGHYMLNTGEILPIGHGQSVSSYQTRKENIGACAGGCLYSSDMLKDIGLFDEYFSTGYEDAELGLRATLAGYKCIYEPKAIVYHKMGNSIGKIFDYQYALKVQKNILYTYFKLMPVSNILLSIPSLILRYFLMSVVYLLFRKWKYLKLLKESFQEIFLKDIKNIQQVRKHFISKELKLTTSQISKKMTFFLMPDINRFIRIFIRRENSAIDTYGKTS